MSNVIALAPWALKVCTCTLTLCLIVAPVEYAFPFLMRVEYVELSWGAGLQLLSKRWCKDLSMNMLAKPAAAIYCSAAVSAISWRNQVYSQWSSSDATTVSWLRWNMLGSLWLINGENFHVCKSYIALWWSVPLTQFKHSVVASSFVPARYALCDRYQVARWFYLSIHSYGPTCLFVGTGSYHPEATR